MKRFPVKVKGSLHVRFKSQILRFEAFSMEQRVFFNFSYTTEGTTEKVYKFNRPVL
jgi:hypothetical protein